MRFLQATLALAMAAVSYCTITPTNTTFNVTVYNDDNIQVNLTQLFNLDASVNASCQVYQTTGNVFTPNTTLVAKDYSVQQFADEPEVARFISNTSIFAVFENTNIMIQNISLDNENFTDTVFYQFGLVGADAICTDITKNDVLNRLYVVCMTNVSSENKAIYIVELDGTTGQKLNLITIPQDQGHQVVHRTNIEMMPLWPGQQGARPHLYVVVYDQGISSGISASNQWALVLDGAESGNLKSIGFANLTNPSLTIVYDMFPHRMHMLVTGKNSTNINSSIVMTLCGIQVDGKGNPSFNCSAQVTPGFFGTVIGYVGILNTGQYVEVNANSQNPDADYLYVCNFLESRGSPSIMIDQDSCNPIHTFQIPNDAAISYVEGNTHQIVIRYTHFDSTYAGYSVHNFDLKFEYSHIDEDSAPHVIPIGKTLIRLNKTTAEILRQVDPYYFVHASDLNPGANLVRIDCTDAQTPQKVSNIFTINMMANMKDMVFTTNITVPEFAAYENSDLFFGIDPHTVMGNDLKMLIVNTDPNTANLTRTQVYDTEFININWRFEKGSANIRETRFVSTYAITLDNNHWLSFSHCSFTDPNDILCVERQAINLGLDNIHLRKETNRVFDWVFAWTSDNTENITSVFIYEPSTHIIHRYNFGGLANDVTMAEVNGLAYLTLAFAEDNRIRGYYFTNQDPSNRYNVFDIDTRLSGQHYFCPVDIDFDPEHVGVLEVLSVCPGKDQRILRYKYPPTPDRQGALQLPLMSDVPINFAYNNPRVCSMGNEFVIYSYLNGKFPNLQSAATYEDRNSWTFGTMNDDLNLGTITKFNCVPRTGVFTTTSNNTGTTILTVYWGNNQWQANHKVFNTVRDGLNSYRYIDSYEFLGGVVHVANVNPTANDYLFSFSNQLIGDIQFLHGIGNQTVPIELRFVNGLNRVAIPKQVNVTALNTPVTLKTIKTTNDVPTNATFPLEDYVQFSGPITDAYIKGTDKVNLVGRVRTLHPYFPGQGMQTTMERLEVFGTIHVSLHITESNSSTFTLFNGVDEFWGIYQPGHGVQAYHFAPFNYSDNNSILIAYSTAEAANNSMQFEYVNNTHRAGIGFFTDNMTRNFTKIRVIPLMSQTQGQDSFLVLAHNIQYTHLHVYMVTVKNGQITPTLMQWIQNVWDFTWAAPDISNTIYVVTVSHDNLANIDFHTFDRYGNQKSVEKHSSAQLLGHTKENGKLMQSLEPYSIMSIVGKSVNTTHFYLLFNTYSNRIYELVFDMSSGSLTPPRVWMYWKLPGFDGHFIDGNQKHIAHMVRDMRHQAENSHRLVIYKRQPDGGQNQVYWTYHNDLSRAFTLTTCPHNMSHLTVTTPFPNAPIFFLEIIPFQLFVKEGADLSQAKLDIVSNVFSSPIEFNVADIINGGGGDDTGSSAKWWPFVLVIGILVLAAAGFIGYKAYSDKKMEAADDPENYQSMKPEGKDVQSA